MDGRVYNITRVGKPLTRQQKRYLQQKILKHIGNDEIRMFKAVKVSDLSLTQLKKIMVKENLEVNGSRENMESDLITSLGCDKVDVIDNVAIESLSIAELEEFCCGIPETQESNISNMRKEQLHQNLRQHIGNDEIRMFKIKKVSDLSLTQLKKMIMEKNLEVNGSRENMESDLITSLGCDEIDIIDNVAIKSLNIAKEGPQWIVQGILKAKRIIIHILQKLNLDQQFKCFIELLEQIQEPVNLNNLIYHVLLFLYQCFMKMFSNFLKKKLTSTRLKILKCRLAKYFPELNNLLLQLQDKFLNYLSQAHN